MNKKILWLVTYFLLFRLGLVPARRFQALRGRYKPLEKDWPGA